MTPQDTSYNNGHNHKGGSMQNLVTSLIPSRRAMAWTFIAGFLGAMWGGLPAVRYMIWPPASGVPPNVGYVVGVTVVGAVLGIAIAGFIYIVMRVVVRVLPKNFE